MIPKECKRLAEVDFPISIVSQSAILENSVRRGLPKSLHLWWARRPLASSRAVLLSLLLPDPTDPNCPENFIELARSALNPLPGVGDARTSDPEKLRNALQRFIGDFSNWNLATNSSYVKAAKELVRAAQGNDSPLVVDPFAGGGAIPLEAMRLGCEAFASDINPVATMILEMTLLEGPKYTAQDLDRFVALAQGHHRTHNAVPFSFLHEGRAREISFHNPLG